MKTRNVRKRQWERYIDRNIKLDPDGYAPRWVERWYKKIVERDNRKIQRMYRKQIAQIMYGYEVPVYEMPAYVLLDGYETADK